VFSALKSSASSASESAWNPVGTAIKTRRRAGGYFRSSSTTYGGAVAITAPRVSAALVMGNNRYCCGFGSV